MKSRNNMSSIKRDIKREIKSFLKYAKEEAQCSLTGIGKIYSNFFSNFLWIIAFTSLIAGICFFSFTFYGVNNLYVLIYIICFIVSFILLLFLIIARIKFYKIFNNLVLIKLKQFNLFVYVINNMNKYGYFELQSRKKEPMISKTNSRNAIIVNDLIEIDMLSWRNVLIGEILSNSFNFVVFNWKIKGISVNKIETSAIIEIFTPFFSHHKIDITNVKRQSNEFLITLGDDNFNNKFFIYSEFDDEEEEEYIYKEVKEIFDKNTIERLLDLEKNGYINNDFRLLIENGKIYFTFEKCKFSYLDLELKKLSSSILLTKIKFNKLVSKDLIELYKIIELLFSLPLFVEKNNN